MWVKILCLRKQPSTGSLSILCCPSVFDDDLERALCSSPALPSTLHKALQEPFTCIYKVDRIINSWFPEEIQQHSSGLLPGLGSKPLSQGSRCRATWSCSTALHWTARVGSCGNSTPGFCTQKALCAELLHHSCCWAILPLLSEGSSR